MSNESLLEYPCDIPIKVFGRNHLQFRELVVSIIRTHFPECPEGNVSERLSKADSYMSLTITVRAESREQVDAAYAELTAHECIMMVL